jgi:hypothetical protein
MSSVPRNTIRFLIILSLLPNSIQAQNYFRSAEALLDECSSQEAFLKGACYGYILGAIDSLEAERYAKRESSCLPPKPEVQHVVDFIISAIRTRPPVSGAMPASISIATVYRETCGLWK